MPDDPLVSSLQTMLAAMDEAAKVTGALIERARDHDARLLELSENVATLGVLMQNHATQHLAGHSLRVVAPVTEADLMQLADRLRAELATEVEQITARIDSVHNKALRALTDLAERKQPA